MKRTLIYVPIVLSLLVLGAHFLRYGNFIGVGGAIVLIGLLFFRRSWVARLMQVVLVLGAVEWVHTLYQLAHVRGMTGQPVARMALILGVVATVTFVSALLFQLPTMQEAYRLAPRR